MTATTHSFPTKCKSEQVHSVGNETAHYYVIVSFTVDVIVTVDTKIAVIISRGFHLIYEPQNRLCIIASCRSITMSYFSSKRLLQMVN